MTDEPTVETTAVHPAHALPDDGPPTYAEVLEARAAAHKEMARAPQAAQDAAAETAAETARVETRKRLRLLLPLMFLVALLVGLSAGVLGAYNSVDLAALRQQSEQRQQQVDDALEKLREANGVLESRGQQPVLAPADPSASDAITAAVTARVIAQLPPTPTAEEVAAQIVPTVTANLTGPSQQRLTALVAAYFAENPPQPGPPPSEAAIRAAVDASLAANPPKQGDKGDKGDPCLPTEPACRGRDGDQGPVGPVGPAGAPPAGWTYRDALNQPHTCTRDPSSPDSAPTYVCD